MASKSKHHVCRLNTLLYRHNIPASDSGRETASSCAGLGILVMAATLFDRFISAFRIFRSQVAFHFSRDMTS